MAFSMLQELGGIGGTPDVGVDDTDNSGNGVLSALENIGINFAAGAASVGVGALARGAGLPPVNAPYSGSSYALRPGVNTAVGQRYVSQTSQPMSTGMLVAGGLLVVLTLAVLAGALRR